MLHRDADSTQLTSRKERHLVAVTQRHPQRDVAGVLGEGECMLLHPVSVYSDPEDDAAGGEGHPQHAPGDELGQAALEGSAVMSYIPIAVVARGPGAVPHVSPH